MTRVLATLDLPLVKAMAPARFKRPISVIYRPLRPRVMAAMACTLTTALSRARRWMKSTSATWSITGSVSGMTTMVVTPPAAAAWLAVEHLHVDEARAEHMPPAIDHPGVLGRIAAQMRAQVGDRRSLHQQPAGLVLAGGRVDQARVEERCRLLRCRTVLAHRALWAVIPGLVPGIQPSSCSGARGQLDPGDERRDDTLVFNLPA